MKLRVADCEFANRAGRHRETCDSARTRLSGKDSADFGPGKRSSLSTKSFGDPSSVVSSKEWGETELEGTSRFRGEYSPRLLLGIQAGSIGSGEYFARSCAQWNVRREKMPRSAGKRAVGEVVRLQLRAVHDPISRETA